MSACYSTSWGKSLVDAGLFGVTMWAEAYWCILQVDYEHDRIRPLHIVCRNDLFLLHSSVPYAMLLGVDLLNLTTLHSNMLTLHRGPIHDPATVQQRK